MQENQQKNSKEKTPQPFSEEIKQGWESLDEVQEYKTPIEGKWIQRGPYIINKSGELEFAVHIGMGKVLVGIDEMGKPILESRQRLTQE